MSSSLSAFSKKCSLDTETEQKHSHKKETSFQHEIAGGTRIVEEKFGTLSNGEDVFKITVTNKSGCNFQVLTYGATVRSLYVPDKSGQFVDVVKGYDTLQDYLDCTSHPNSVIGRVAHRISNAYFETKTYTNFKEYCISQNDGDHHYDGGHKGFNTKNFSFKVKGSRVILTCNSADDEEGYPGKLRLNVGFQLNAWNEFIIDYEATCSAISPVNVTHKIYFNLAGNNTKNSIEKHTLQILADKYLPTDKGDPRHVTGEIKEVDGTDYDMKTPKSVKALFDTLGGSGKVYKYFCLRTEEKSVFDERDVAKLYCPNTNILMEVSTSYPGVLIESLDSPNADRSFQGLAFACSGFPDALLFQPQFPDIRLQHGEVYYRAIHFKFSTPETFP